MDLQQMTLFEEPDAHPAGSPVFRGGGFPCQPHSVAGKRKASGDERDLWPEMRRVIGEIKPRWVVAENVRGLLSSEDGRFFLGILRDFAEMGYDVAWGITSAAAVGAPHRRERVAIVAHTGSQGLQGLQLCGSYSTREGQGRTRAYGPTSECCNDGRSESSSVWEPEPIVGRVAHGVPNRVDRIKCLGNAVVPQQFYPVFKAIAGIEENYDRAKQKNSQSVP